MSTGCWEKKEKPVGRKGLRILGWGWTDPKSREGKVRRRSSLVFSCFSCRRRELFLTNVSEPGLIGPFSIRQVLPLKLEGVEGCKKLGITCLWFWSCSKGECGSLYDQQYLCRVRMSPAWCPAEKGESEGIWGRTLALGSTSSRSSGKLQRGLPKTLLCNEV